MTTSQDSVPSDRHVHCPPVILTAAEGSVEVLPLPNGRFKVTLKPNDPNNLIACAYCETSLPLDMISACLKISFAWLCDTLALYEEPEYVKTVIIPQLLAYVDIADLRGKRLLDFGCGVGSSTFCIAAMFPETEVVGVDQDECRVAAARRLLAARPLANIQFVFSPDPKSTPPGIGAFDIVMLNNVYEHLLPEERRHVMPLIWSSMHYGGVLFVNSTPYRYFPFEHHSTGLWFINYLPDGVCLYLARNFSKTHRDLNKSRDWPGHLRGGIRGGTEAAILRNLRLAGEGRPTIIQPRGQDRASYWLASTNPGRYRLLKTAIAALFRLTDRLWGTVPSMYMEVAIRKDPA